MQRQRTGARTDASRRMHTCVLAARATSAVFGHDLGSGASPTYLGDTQMKPGRSGLHQTGIIFHWIIKHCRNELPPWHYFIVDSHKLQYKIPIKRRNVLNINNDLNIRKSRRVIESKYSGNFFIFIFFLLFVCLLNSKSHWFQKYLMNIGKCVYY